MPRGHHDSACKWKQTSSSLSTFRFRETANSAFTLQAAFSFMRVTNSNSSDRATFNSLFLPSVTTAKEGRQPSWSSGRCSLIVPLVQRNLAQSNNDTNRSITLPPRPVTNCRTWLAAAFTMLRRGTRTSGVMRSCWANPVGMAPGDTRGLRVLQALASEPRRSGLAAQQLLSQRSKPPPCYNILFQPAWNPGAVVCFLTSDRCS